MRQSIAYRYTCTAIPTAENFCRLPAKDGRPRSEPTASPPRAPQDHHRLVVDIARALSGRRRLYHRAVPVKSLITNRRHASRHDAAMADMPTSAPRTYRLHRPDTDASSSAQSDVSPRAGDMTVWNPQKNRAPCTSLCLRRTPGCECSCDCTLASMPFHAFYPLLATFLSDN
eukprot:SAG31_NODE_1346_length_8698_cov_1.561693_1_plen_172_part_00